ncbi:MAG: hypothetical protein ACRC3Y_14870 [Romboutsia sp.]|uniref:hypothetical protein n=1 Tax=Romboutsia sp. TaxID=1965302 RepID=UPI003F3382C6
MIFGWLTTGSILFGLISIIVPIINLMRQDKGAVSNLGVFSGISISACAISLCMQIFYANHLVQIEDFTAMMDIFGTVASVSALLLLATITLNIITYMVYKKSHI